MRRWSRAPRVPAAARGDDRLDAAAALAADELGVLLGEPAARAEERGLDRRPAHAEPLADLAVAEALELAHDEDLVVGLGEAAEGAAQVVERHLLVDRDVGRRGRRDEAAVVAGREPLVGVVGDLLGAPGAPELVDAGVLGDLVDPRLERDRPVGLAHAAQRRHEDVLRDVLGAGVVVDHAVDVGGDPPVVALVESLERAVVAARVQLRPAGGRSVPHRSRRRRRDRGRDRCHAPHSPCRSSTGRIIHDGPPPLTEL